MFRHEGPARLPRNNAILAGYLAVIAGFVNSGGFVLIGSYTSHVTGSVGRMSTDVATGRAGAALSAALLVLGFFAGSFVASTVLESMAATRLARAYGIALLVEGLSLLSFVFLAGLSRLTHARALDAEAIILCLAMGMQNSLVTRLSGSVVRTTHLTGVVTDLGIEAARWYRWYIVRRRPLGEMGPRLDRPSSARSLLLLTIVGAFVVGSIAGALVTIWASRWAMLAPAMGILFASAYAFYSNPADDNP